MALAPRGPGRLKTPKTGWPLPTPPRTGPQTICAALARLRPFLSQSRPPAWQTRLWIVARPKSSSAVVVVDERRLVRRAPEVPICGDPGEVVARGPASVASPGEFALSCAAARSSALVMRPLSSAIAASLAAATAGRRAPPPSDA